jgi:kinetochore protein Spc7/SPC105
VTEHIRRLNLSFPTTTAVVAINTADGSSSPSAVAVTVSVLVAPVQTRVEVVLTMSAKSRDGGGGGLEVVAVPEVRVVYGESFNVGKMTEFLAGRIGRVGGGGGVGEKEGGKEGGEMGWDEAVLELYQRLLAKGKQKQ